MADERRQQNLRDRDGGLGHVYAGDLGGGFHAFDEDTGSLSWSSSTGGYVYSAAAAAKTHDTPPTVYFGSYDGTVYALNARTGSQRWSEFANGPVSGAGSGVATSSTSAI